MINSQGQEAEVSQGDIKAFFEGEKSIFDKQKSVEDLFIGGDLITEGGVATRITANNIDSLMKKNGTFIRLENIDLSFEDICYRLIKKCDKLLEKYSEKEEVKKDG